MSEYEDSFEVESSSENSAQQSLVASAPFVGEPTSDAVPREPSAFFSPHPAYASSPDISTEDSFDEEEESGVRQHYRHRVSGPLPTSIPFSGPVPIPVAVLKSDTSSNASTPTSEALPPSTEPQHAGIQSLSEPHVDDRTSWPMSSAQPPNTDERKSTMTDTSSNPDDDLKRFAALATAQPEFQLLSKYTAFASPSFTNPSFTNSTRTSRLDGTPESLPIAPPFLQKPPTPPTRDTLHPPASPQVGFSPPPPQPAPLVLSPPQPQQESEAEEAVPSSPQPSTSSVKTSSDSKAASAVPSSSVFSTLSQHLRQQPAIPVVPISTKAAAATPAPVIASPPLPSPPLALSSTTTVETIAPPAVAPGKKSVPSLPLPSLTLPSLPRPGWVTETEVATMATMGDVETTQPAGLIEYSNSKLRLEGRPSLSDDSSRQPSYALFLPSSQKEAPRPPRPPQSQPQPQPSAESARVSELREASEAVERLAKAFAVLKGYGTTAQGNPPSSFVQNTAVESAATSTAHRVGASSTIQLQSQSLPSRRMGTPLPREKATESADSDDGAASLYQNEELLENVVLDCVLHLLKDDRAGAAAYVGRRTVAEDVSHFAARPHSETVTAEDFTFSRDQGRGRSGTPAASLRGHSRGNAAAPFLSMIDGEMAVFDPADRQSMNDLYNCVREALKKYILRRVLTPRARNSIVTTTSPQQISPITPQFAWTLLLDIMSVCNEVARSRFNGVADDATMPYPVLVQFTGDPPGEEVARNAMHCLPFEALQSSDGGFAAKASATTATHRGTSCVFRLACWVTRAQMWAVVDAVADTVREHVVQSAKTWQYFPFTTPEVVAEIDPRVLVPSQLPMFALLAPPQQTSSTGSEQRVRFFAGESTDETVRGKGGPSLSSPLKRAASTTNAFDVDAEAMESASYHISVIATDILSTTSAPDSITSAVTRAEDYSALTKVVSETIGELLQDVSIRAAVLRRATSKFQTRQAERKDYSTVQRQRKEKIIIDRAEKEAERIVQHIMQEMLVQKGELGV